MSGGGSAERQTGAAANRLVLAGGDRPRLRKASRRDWTKAKEARFLSALTETCNVTRACDEAKVSVSAAYRRRKANAAFRAGWIEAIGTAYQRLELVLIERALNGTEKIITKADGREERMREYPNQLALALLRMHRDTAADAETEVPQEDVEEIRERLLHKLGRLRERFEREDAADA